MIYDGILFTDLYARGGSSNLWDDGQGGKCHPTS